MKLRENFNNWPVYSLDEIKVAKKILTSGKVNYWTGEYGKSFESEFSKYTGVKHSIALANGTLALELALKAIDIQKGDEVIVTPRSFIASVSCVINSGAIPVFADVDKNSGNIEYQTIKQKITSKTKAIICVHLGGWPCDMKKIMDLANDRNIFVIEDCAQAHGAEYNNNSVGSIGHIGTWSFCQDKIMSTAGEGGMITTNDNELWEKMWSFKDHGKNFNLVNSKNKSNGFKWLHQSFGSNYRLTEIQSAIGMLQLKKLDKWKALRKANAESLISAMGNFEQSVRIPRCSVNMENAFYRLYVYVKKSKLKSGWSRDRIIQTINHHGVPCFQGSCPEIYLEEAFSGLANRPKKRLENAQYLGERSIAFLVHPTLEKDQIRLMKKIIAKVFSEALR